MTSGAGEEGGDPGMEVEIVFFARIREIVGTDSASLRLPRGCDVDRCFRALVQEHPGLQSLRGRIAAAVNEEYAAWDRVLEDGDVITFIPPVSGGARR